MLAAKLQTEALSRRIDFIPAASSNTGAYDIPRLVSSMKKEGVPVFVLGKKSVKAMAPLTNGNAGGADGDENEKKVRQCEMNRVPWDVGWREVGGVTCLRGE